MSIPDGSILVQVEFVDGPLGVTLRRRSGDGIVYVHEIVPGSQAIKLDIEHGDELWQVGDSVIGTTALDKDGWQALVEYIKGCPRPLKMVWRRRLKDVYDDSQRLQPPSISPTFDSIVSNSSPNSNFNSNLSSSSSSSSSSSTAMEISPRLAAPIKPSKKVIVNPFVTKFSPTSSTMTINPVSENKPSMKIESMIVAPEPIEQIGKESQSEIDGNSNGNVDVDVDVDAAILNEISSQLYVKDKTTSGLASFIGKRSGKTISHDGKMVTLTPYTLPSNIDRKLLKFGEMTLVYSKCASISMAQPNKMFILLSDLLLISILYPDNILLVEEVINLQVCKVRTYLIPPRALVDSDTPSVFDVIWPAGIIQTGFMTDLGKEEWLNSIFQAICSCTGYGNDILGWKHQHMLGTVHSAVVLRDAQLLQDILIGCDNHVLEFNIIEALDDAGYTPLHYATIFRFTNIVQILHDASANVDIPDRNGLTCLHWSSMLLDEDCLNILTTHSVDVDIRDYDDRTPLFLVIVEGRDKNGKPNISAMKSCAEKLLSLHAEPNVADHHGCTLLHYLAASWMNELIEVLMQNKVDVMATDYDNGMTALHFAARGLPLRRKMSEVTALLSPNSQYTKDHRDELEETDLKTAIPTLKVLLQMGARPNFKDSQGKTPLHHISENMDTTWGDSLGYAVITLLTFGARLDDSYQCQMLKSRLSGMELDTVLETRLNAPIIDADTASISYFSPVREAAIPQYSADGKEKLLPNCVLCGINFTLFRRQHHCRMCSALCCDDCSKRRVILQGKEARACDSCYNRVAYVLESKQRGRNSSISSYSSSSLSSYSKQSSIPPPDMKKDASKSKLFGTTNTNSMSPVKELSVTESRSPTISQNVSAMNEAHQRLQERGEKLSVLSDRSADLANSANDFAKLAKQLKEQQKSGWF